MSNNDHELKKELWVAVQNAFNRRLHQIFNIWTGTEIGSSLNYLISKTSTVLMWFEYEQNNLIS